MATPTPGGSAGAVLRRAAAGLGRGARAFHQYVRDLLGESAYDRYVVAHRRDHPEHEPLTPREWWRQRSDEMERSPQTRCC